jgi:hypothetical protein
MIELRVTGLLVPRPGKNGVEIRAGRVVGHVQNRVPEIPDLRTKSPDRRLAFAMAPVNGIPTTAVLEVPLDGGAVHRICPGTCAVRWSPDGASMYITPLPGSARK